MSEIQATAYDGSDNNVPAENYRIYQEADGRVVVMTSTAYASDDTVEMIWHDDGSLTIVINGENALWLTADQAENVFINTASGNDNIFVTGDTPSGNTLVLHGGDGDDMIVGSDGDEQLEGGNGSDRLWGMGGNDKLYSMDTRGSRDRAVDYMYGGEGNDLMAGGDGDQSHGNAGVDEFHGGTTFGSTNDIGYAGGLDNLETADELSAPAPTFASNEDNIRYASGPTGTEAPSDADPAESGESVPAEDAASDLGPGAPPEDLPVADPPIGNENMEVPEEPPVPLDASAEEQPQLIFDQLDGFYKSTVEDLNQASEDALAQAQLAADAGDMDLAKAWAAKADWYASQAERLSGAAEVRFGLVEELESSESVDAFFNVANETIQDIKGQAAEARANADEAELIAGGVESEGTESESTTEEPAEAPSASDSEAPAAASSPDLPSTLPGGDTAAGQVFHFNDQLTGFYADEISQALDNTQTYAENAQTAADSGDTEGAQLWARMAVQESARADQLLKEAQSRLDAAEQQLEEVLNDPDATPEEKAMAQQQFDEAKLAVETAETQATEAAGFAEEARVAAGLSEDDDGSVPPTEDATTEPGAEGAEGSEPEAAGATSGEEGAEPEADGEETGSEGDEAPGAAAPAGGSESSEDPYDQAMDNATEGTNRQESDRRSRGRSGNFLVAMAEALGLMQAKFLGNAMKHLDTMDSLSSEEIPEGDANAERQHREAFLIAQSKFQAEMQMFNIVSQASATSLRSTGEGMAAVVRKN